MAGREWAIPDEDMQLLRYYFRAIDTLLEQARMRDTRLIEMKTPMQILDGARLRDPTFKKDTSLKKGEDHGQKRPGIHSEVPDLRKP